MPDVSIALSAKDNFSDTLKKLANNANTSVKDVDALQKSLDRLNGTKVNLRTNMDKVKAELSTAKKAFLELGDAESEAAYKAKQSEYDTLSSQLKAVSNSAKQAERDMQSLAGTNSKLTNRAGMGESSDAGGMGGSMLGTVGGALATAGFGKMLAGSLQGAANTFIGSYFGDMAGSAVSSVLGEGLSGAAMGAAAGSIIPGVGTAIGAAVGGVIGAVSGGITAASENFQKKDDAYKGYVQGQVEAVQQKQAEDLTGGSGIAAQRETDLTSFSTLFSSKDIAQNYLNDLKDMANSTPFLYGDLTAMSKTLKTFGYGVDEMIPTLTKVGDTGAALGMTTSDMVEISKGVGRMKNMSTVTREPLDILRDRGVDAYGFLANAKGVSKGELDKLISTGKISGEEAASIILDAMGESFGGAMEQQSKTFAGLTSTLEGWNQETQNAMGEGYNEGRKEGLTNQIDFLQGDAGTKMQEVYAEMGTLQADLENMQEGMYRDIVDGMFSGDIAAGMDEKITEQVQTMHDRYQQAMATLDSSTASDADKVAARAELGALMGEAQALAESEYYNSEAVTTLTEANITMADGIASGAGSAYENAGFTLGQKLTTGLGRQISSYSPPTIRVPVTTYLTGGSVPGLTTGNSIGKDTTTYRASSYLTGGPTAFGEDRVPHDNMLYLLHEGERVRTAQQARQDDMAGGGVTINITGGNYSVRQDSDIDAIADRVARRVAQEFQMLKPR
ncbi:tape measure protein [Agathobaculum sp. NTUH-O15-33]|uniref:tape measure protein n=1 Tax=Agathobaculum sp. NTUH-O15-33 TaxID=3079302 RepID=UPI002958A67F|nr:tape measure protein [Agathobaculum sp. NTUH-O15-33]WNX85791.1 tape measure protein [Agathobaculum sp. NTUH-O15-33]